MDEKIREQIEKSLEQAEKSDGFLVAISYRRDDTLYHWQVHSLQFEDAIKSMDQLKGLVIDKHMQPPKVAS